MLVDLNQADEGRSLLMQFLDELIWAKSAAEISIAAACFKEALEHTQAVVEVLN